MKQIKKLFLTVALAAASVSAFGIDFGARAGLNINNLAGLGSEYTQSKFAPGVYAGAVVDIDLPVPMLGVRVEPMFSMQGAKRYGEVLKKGVNFDWNFNYVNVPVLAEVKLLGGDLAFLVGPQIGFSVASSLKTSDAEGKNTNTQKFDKEDINSFDAGLSLGASYMITRNLGVDLRYYLGLSNISKDSDNAINNRVLSIGVSFIL